MATDLTAVLFALNREAKYWRQRGVKITEAPCEAYRIGSSLLVLFTGMGQEAAQRAVEWLLQTYPNVGCVISAGFCGALVEGLEVGDVLTPGQVVSEKDTFHLIGNDQVSLFTASRPICSTSDRLQLHQATRCQIVDMETAAIAQQCDKVGIACRSIRVVSDDWRNGFPSDLLPALDGKRIRLGKLLSAIGRRPSLIVDLLRLAKDSQVAAKVLAVALDDNLTMMRERRQQG